MLGPESNLRDVQKLGIPRSWRHRLIMTSSFVTGEDLNGELYGPGILPDEKKWRVADRRDLEDSGHMERWQFNFGNVYQNDFIDDPWKLTYPTKTDTTGSTGMTGTSFSKPLRNSWLDPPKKGAPSHYRWRLRSMSLKGNSSPPFWSWFFRWEVPWSCWRCRVKLHQVLKKWTWLLACRCFFADSLISYSPSKIKWDRIPTDPDQASCDRTIFRFTRFYQGPFCGSCWRFLGLIDFFCLIH